MSLNKAGFVFSMRLLLCIRFVDVYNVSRYLTFVKKKNKLFFILGPHGKVAILLDGNDPLVCLKVRPLLTIWSGEPHPLRARRDWLRCFHVCQDDKPVEVAFVTPSGWSIKAGSTGQHPFCDMALTLFPDIDLAIVDPCIEGNHGELGILGKSVEFCEEGGEHLVSDRAGLVDSHGNLGVTGDLLSGIPLSTILFIVSLDG